MNNFTILKEHQRSKSTNESLSQLREAVGFVPNVYTAIASSDVALNAFMDMNTHFSNSLFSETEKQIILLATSTENECEYCVAGHTTFSKSLGIPKDLIDAMRDGRNLENKRLNVLNQFTRALVRDRGRVSRQQVSEFFEAGYTQSNVIEIILGISVKTFSNLTSILLEIPLDKSFETNAWCSNKSTVKKSIAA